jgi:hypothetical protein
MITNYNELMIFFHTYYNSDPSTTLPMKHSVHNYSDLVSAEMTIYCLLNSNHRLTGPVPGRASPAVRGVLIWDTPIDVPRLKQVNWLVNYVAWEILLIWNLLYRIWKNYW